VGDDEKSTSAGDAGDDTAATASRSGEPSAEEQAIARANIEKVDEILDDAGVNEGIAAGSRETHPDEGGPRR
jgi:hypothetical protein